LKPTFNTGQRRKELDQRLEKAGLQFEWEDIKHDLNEYSGESVPPIPGESVPGIPRYNVPPIPGQSVPPF